MKSININEVKNLNKDYCIDVREVEEYNNLSIPGIKNIPLLTLISNPSDYLNKEDTYYIMCHSGNRSQKACLMLENQGYEVVNLAGGIMGYVS